jgi:hypothetical protein
LVGKIEDWLVVTGVIATVIGVVAFSRRVGAIKN